MLGEALRNTPRDRFQIATKLYYPVGDEPDHGLSAAQVEKQLNRSLQRLGVELIYVYQSQRDDAHTPVEETMFAVVGAVRAGKVRSIGFSEWNAGQIQAATEIAKANSLISFVSSQPQYSILWRKPEVRSLSMCETHGIE